MTGLIGLQRDEEVGVYGFIFYKDNGWVSVIIDESVHVFLQNFVIPQTSLMVTLPFVQRS